MDQPLPGWDAHKKMINYDRPNPTEAQLIHPNARKGAVLALLYPHQEKTFIALMKRNDYEGVHSGQVSLPGGKFEDDDKTLQNTALREAQEEVGINQKSVEILGTLSPVYIPPSNFLVTPFLGISNNRPEFQTDPVEVASLIEAPIDYLLRRDLLKEKPMFLQVFNTKVKVRYFDIDGHVVWGATAMILSEIKELILRT